MNTSFAPWEQPIWDRLQQARETGRLSHGLLFCGPVGAGQSLLASELAAVLLCHSPVQGRACAQCRSCQLRVAGSNGDLRRITLLERDDGRLKTEIGVEQIRELSAWFSLTPQYGHGQVALIDPADRLNISAANAVLKTLEEPAEERFLLLVSEQLQRLPATVRSRCQRVEMRLPTREAALQWLCESGLDPAQAERALDVADGNPRRAAELAQGSALSHCDEVLADMNALAQGRDQPASVARRWLSEHADLRLTFAARLVRDLGVQRAAGRRVAAGLTATADFHKLAAWARQLERTRSLMPVPLRHELLLTELLQAWSAMARVR